ncbi:MAG: response regulator [Acidobacteria bacterium]|nr:response regulator [Acidobacteriota bacterium]
MAHILIVDDDRVVGETFARMLTLEGHRVTTVQSAESALTAAGADLPDALILDMRMPVVSGLDFLRQLRRDPHLREMPVAIVTGDYFLNEPVLAEMRALGATVRYKPLWMDDLSALAQSLLTKG